MSDCDKIYKMSYSDENFWEMYKSYLHEVKDRHEIPLSIWKNMVRDKSLDILELGCGQAREFVKYINDLEYSYSAVELNPPLGAFNIIKQDYRESFDKYNVLDFNTLISLFSSEITGSPEENKNLYDKLFNQYYIDNALVSGFYYKNKMNINPVEETGGLTSWQTLFQPGEYDGKFFKEDFRIVLAVPSKLFGDDVVEVWRILKRK